MAQVYDLKRYVDSPDQRPPVADYYGAEWESKLISGRGRLLLFRSLMWLADNLRWAADVVDRTADRVAVQSKCPGD